MVTEVTPVDSAPVPAEFLQAASAIALLPGGVAVLFDRDTKAIFCLDIPTRSVVCRFGRGGSGPGEFQSATAIRTDARGRIAVADVSLRRITVLTPEHQLQTTVPIIQTLGPILRFAGDTIVLGWINGLTPEAGVVDLATGTSKVFVRPFDADSALAEIEPGASVPSSFLAFAGRTDGSVLVGAPLRYRIVAINPAGVATLWGERTDVPRTIPTAPEIEETVSRIERMMSVVPPAARPSKETLREQASRPKPFFWVFNMVSDETDRLWVITRRASGDSTVVDLFGSDGRYQRSFTFPHRFSELSVAGNQLAYRANSSTGTDDLEQVHLYQITGP